MKTHRFSPFLVAHLFHRPSTPRTQPAVLHEGRPAGVRQGLGAGPLPAPAGVPPFLGILESASDFLNVRFYLVLACSDYLPHIARLPNHIYVQPVSNLPLCLAVRLGHPAPLRQIHSKYTCALMQTQLTQPIYICHGVQQRHCNRRCPVFWRIIFHFMCDFFFWRDDFSAHPLQLLFFVFPTKCLSCFSPTS